MLSSSRRQRRTQRQQQRQEQQQQQLQNGHVIQGSRDSVSPPNIPYQQQQQQRHPYHQQHLPIHQLVVTPRHLLRDERPLSSGEIPSSVSDMSLEDFSGGAQDSVLEYSDTDNDGDHREESSSYFQYGLSPDQKSNIRYSDRPGQHRHQHQPNHKNKNNIQNSNHTNMTSSSRRTEASGESAFRRLRGHNGLSSRVVQFNSGGSQDHLGFTFQDEYQAVDEDGLIRHPGSYPSPSPPPPPSSKNLRPSSSGEGGMSDEVGGFLTLNWLSSLAFAFRSPSPQQVSNNNLNSTNSSSNENIKLNEDSENEEDNKEEKKCNSTSGRFDQSQSSSGIMEYPHASILPSYTTTAAEQQERLRPGSSPSNISPAGAGSTSGPWEQSPLLSSSTTKGSAYGGAGESSYPPPTPPPHSLLLLKGTPSNTNGNNKKTQTGEAAKGNSGGRPPPSPPLPSKPLQLQNKQQQQQQRPRYPNPHPQQPIDSMHVHGPSGMSRTRAATIAAYFLMDYEAGRPPTLSSDFHAITLNQLRLYRVHFMSWPWRVFGIYGAVLALFVAHASSNNFHLALLHTYAILIFFTEIYARENMYDGNKAIATTAMTTNRYPSHSDRLLVKPMIFFLIVLGIESWLWTLSGVHPTDIGYQNLLSAWLKPLVFFYASARAREAVEALSRIARMVTRILLIEVFLILTFAAVACRLFHEYDSFKTLPRSWLSLFELSTTVNNPSLWMPLYETSRWNATFFIFFIVTAVFYLHSLLLSVVFQTYIQAATEIQERSATDREDAVRLAFLALTKVDQTDVISTGNVRKTLQMVRPHYNAMKIKALMEIVDPSNQHVIDYPTFRTKIRQALNASIRTSRNSSNFAMGVELIAVLVAVVNFIYVMLLASEFKADWFDTIAASTGSIITLLGLLELVIRFNPLRIANFAPITRLNGVFDGLALTAALVSCIGIVQYIRGNKSATDLILMGRAIDMIRIMRFFQIFRDVVRRSADVLPAMAGPVILVLTTLHVFVYIGMAFWGGAVDIDKMSQNPNVTALYYFNNFNSYGEGLVTMFNVLVVNDWNSLAGVFIYADRCSSPLIVYPFFVTAILITVFIMLNVITAFFVESFVTKLSDGGSADPNMGDGVDPLPKERDFVIQTGENANPNVKHIHSRPYNEELVVKNVGAKTPIDNKQNPGAIANDASSTSSGSSNEIFTFDVYAREGFDQIMKTVAGSSDAQEEMFARSICDYLEIFESLSPGREKVGYMVCCQRSMSRFGNRRFQTVARDFVPDEVLHTVVSDMHAELLVLTSSRKTFDDRCIFRTFAHRTDPTSTLEISASLLRHHPAVSVLVSRVRNRTSEDVMR